MSTKKIRELLRWARVQDADTHAFDGTFVGPPNLSDVEAELEAIEKAARFVTSVDTNAAVTPGLAREAAEASDTLERIAKESNT